MALWCPFPDSSGCSPPIGGCLMPISSEGGQRAARGAVSERRAGRSVSGARAALSKAVEQAARGAVERALSPTRDPSSDPPRAAINVVHQDVLAEVLGISVERPAAIESG